MPLPPGTPGGGGPELRRQLGILKEFIEGFDFVRMKADLSVPKSGASPTVSKEAAKVRVLAAPGRAYAVYVNGGTKVELDFELSANEYTVDGWTPRPAR